MVLLSCPAKHKYEALLSVYTRRFERGRALLARREGSERIDGSVHQMLVDISTVHQVASGRLFLTMDNVTQSAYQQNFINNVNYLSVRAGVPPLSAILRAKRAADRLYKSLGAQLAALTRKQRRPVAPPEHCAL